MHLEYFLRRNCFLSWKLFFFSFSSYISGHFIFLLVSSFLSLALYSASSVLFCLQFSSACAHSCLSSCIQNHMYIFNIHLGYRIYTYTYTLLNFFWNPNMLTACRSPWLLHSHFKLSWSKLVLISISERLFCSTYHFWISVRSSQPYCLF